MPNPVYFTVVADFKAFVEDAASDSDYDPQIVPVSGTVTFTPLVNSGDVVRATQASPRPVGYIPAPITGLIDAADGRLKLRKTADSGGSGTFAPVRLLGTCDLLELDGPLFYRVSFSDVVFSNNRRGSITGFTFEAPNTDTELNLITVAKAAGQPASGITKIAPTAVRFDGGNMIFSFSGVDIPDPLPLTSITGPTGATGATGPVGATGATGAPGTTTWSGITDKPAVIAAGVDAAAARNAISAEYTGNKGQANGYASLDSSGLVPSAQLPAFVDDVLEYSATSAFPGTGETGKIYVALDTNKVYRWGGSSYTEISPSPGSTDAVPEGSTNLYYTAGRADGRITAAIGSTVQAYSATLTSWSGKTVPTGTVVGTTDAQALTNKDLSGAGNTWPTFNQDTTGNAATADKLKTARTVQVDLGATGAASFDGSANISPGVTGSLPQASVTNLTSDLSGKVTSGGALGTPSSGTLTNCTGLPLAGLASAAYATAATASTLAQRDANANLTADNFIATAASTATTAGTTTLTIDDPQVQVFTGTSTQTVKLPTTGVVAGQQYTIINNSTGTITVQSSGANNLSIGVVAGSAVTYTAKINTPTAAADWTTTALTGSTSATAAVTTLIRDGAGVANSAAFSPSLGSFATAGLTTTMSQAYGEIVLFTGTQTQTCQLPTTGVPAGRRYAIINNSTGAVTVTASGGATVFVLPASTSAVFVSLQATPTTAAHWSTMPVPVANITASTTAALGVGSIELGHASDTTLTRSAAGELSVEGVVVDTASNTLTLTNKTLTAPKISSGGAPASATATGTTGTIAWDANYIYVCTATNTWVRAALSTW